MNFKFYSLILSGIMIVIFILQLLIPGFTDLFVLNSNSFPELWRFITAIFLHGSVPHILYNLFALLLFGFMLEKLIGSKKFLIVFFVTGILANLFSVWFYPSSLGASGAIFGIIGALIVIRPTLPVWAFGLPMPIFIAGILWAGGDILGAAAYFSGNPIDNTGNLAHLSGMAFGFLLGFLYKKPKQRKNPGIQLQETYVQSWEDSYLK